VLPNTIVGLLVLGVAVLPGLVYTLAFERQAGDYGATFTDRSMRFVAVSVVYHLVAGWPEYWIYRVTLAERGPLSFGEFALLWLAALAAVAAPFAVGTVLGHMYRTRSHRPGWQRRFLRLALGPDLAPRAWDELFSERPTTYLRVRTTEGNFLGGLFASRSYAAGFPQEPDLLLEEAYRVDPDTGELGEPLGYPVYIAAGKIAWLEIIHPQDSQGG
jgi:Family of unknown function (DUF6338)